MCNNKTRMIVCFSLNVMRMERIKEEQIRGKAQIAEKKREPGDVT